MPNPNKQAGQKKSKFQFRPNVLILMLAAYGTLLLMFGILVFKANIPPDTAWDILKAPLMALIGGSIAIAKDLIQDEDKEG